MRQKLCKQLLILLLLINTSPAFAEFDPLSTDKNLPKKHYKFYQEKEQNNEDLINKSCEIANIYNQQIDILQAINFALCNNPQTRISWLNIKQKAALYGISKSAYLPNVDLGISRSKGNMDSAGIETSTTTNNKTISFDWLLFDFGKREYAVKRDYFALIQSAQQHNDVLQKFIYQTIESYSNLFSSKETVEAAKRSEESNKIAFEVAQKKFKLGLVPKADVFRAETNYSQATLNRQRAQNAAANYLGQFLQILNLPQGSQINISEPSFIKDDELLKQDVQSLITHALQNRPDLKAIIAQERAAKADRMNAKLDNLPTISLYGSKNYQNTRNQASQESDSVGLRLTFPFFSGFSKFYSSKRYDLSYKTSKEERIKIQNQIALDVWQAYQDFKTSYETQITAQKLLKSATESKNVALGMYKVGRGTIIEVTSSEASYAEAENEMIAAKYSKFNSQAALLLAIGELNRFNESINLQ